MHIPAVPDKTRDTLLALGWTPPAESSPEPSVDEPNVYRERAHLLAYLATKHPAVLAYTDPAEPDWPVLYLDTPQGQMSWHIAPDDIELFAHVPISTVPGQPAWDGHTTTEKYQRLAQLVGDLAGGRQDGEG